MKKTLITLAVLTIIAIVTPFAIAVGPHLEPVFATYSGATSFTYTNSNVRGAILALWVQDAATSTMTVSVVNGSGYTNTLVDATVTNELRYLDGGAQVPLTTGGKLIVSGCSTNSVKLSLYRVDVSR